MSLLFAIGSYLCFLNALDNKKGKYESLSIAWFCLGIAQLLVSVGFAIHILPIKF